jgi:nicotinamidase/pyrazinamidase
MKPMLPSKICEITATCSVGSMIEYSPITALVVVDCQNDFADPDGSLFVNGAAGVIAAVNREVIAAVAAGAPVVYTQDWHPESTPHFQKDGGIWPVHCLADSWGADFHPRLIVAGPSVKKGINGEDGYSGFTMRNPETEETSPTELHGWLTDCGVRAIVVVGLALDYCVKATAVDGVSLGYAVTVPDATTAAVNLAEGDGDRAKEELSAGGVTIV